MAEDEKDGKRNYFGTETLWVWAAVGCGGLAGVLALVGSADAAIGTVVLGLLIVLVALLVDGWKRPSPARVPKIGQSGSSGSSDLILQELASIKKLIGWGVFVIGLILSIQTILLFLF